MRVRHMGPPISHGDESRVTWAATAFGAVIICGTLLLVEAISPELAIGLGLAALGYAVLRLIGGQK